MRKFITSILIAAAAIAAPVQLVHANEAKPQLVQIVPADQGATSGAAAVIRETRLFAESLGDGMMTVATKMGLAAKEFIDSPVGRAVAFGLFMKYFGGMVIKLCLIPLTFGFAVSFFRRGINVLQGRNQVPAQIEYIPRTGIPGWFGLQERRVTSWKNPGEEEGAAFMPFVIGAVLLIGTFIMIGSF